MSNLENFQEFIRKNGKEITGINVPVILSEEENKNANLRFTFGWTISVGVSKQDHGSYCPSGSYYGSVATAEQEAHSCAKKYISGKDPLFNNRMQKCLCNDVEKNFAQGDENLRSAPETFVGKDACYSCHGSGSNSCYSCHGSGKSSCSSCSGSGRRNVQKYDSYNDRTVYTTESCGSCWGSGNQTCSPCGGSGSITCSTCSGGGYLYASFSIDGEATRSTSFKHLNDDYHSWATPFIKNAGRSILYSLNDVKEVDVEGNYGGCTFYYAMKAVLPTLQFKADVSGGSTYVKFIGKTNLTYDAGGVYDPAVWSIGKKLGSGDKDTDTQVLAVPAIKSIIESSETKTQIDLVSQNWISSSIQDAVVENYHELVRQLKKASNKGIVGKIFTGLFKNAYLFIMYAAFVALLTPEFAIDVDQRFNVSNYVRLVSDYFSGYYRLFGVHQFLNIAVALIYFWVVYKGVCKFYWKRIGKFKTYTIALIVAFAVPFAALTTFVALLSVTRYDFNLVNLFVGGSVFVCIYFFFWAFAKPKRWYLKPLTAVGALALILALQFGLMAMSAPIDWETLQAGSISYMREIDEMLYPAKKYVLSNVIEIFFMTILFTYFATRRRFWLNTKATVVEYNSPVLLKSMSMD